MTSKIWSFPFGLPTRGVMMATCNNRLVMQGEIPALEALRFSDQGRMIDIITPNEREFCAIYAQLDGDPIEVVANGDERVSLLDKGDDIAKWLKRVLRHPEEVRLVLLPFGP